MAVFAGGATMAAVAAVTHDVVDISDGVTTLVNHQLLRYRERGGETGEENGTCGEARLDMLETVREYAWERLEESGELDTAAQAHCAFYLALAQEAEGQLHGAEQAAWLRQLETEHPNPRAALTWTVQQRKSDLAVRLASVLSRFWYMHGHAGEGYRWMQAVLALPTETADDTHAAHTAQRARARAFNGAGNQAMALGAFTEAAT
jgi:predicted ATPase